MNWHGIVKLHFHTQTSANSCSSQKCKCAAHHCTSLMVCATATPCGQLINWEVSDDKKLRIPSIISDQQSTQPQQGRGCVTNSNCAFIRAHCDWNSLSPSRSPPELWHCMNTHEQAWKLHSQMLSYYQSYDQLSCIATRATLEASQWCT